MAAADYRMMTDATGQDLVAALQNLAPLQVAPLVVSIPTGQWSGSGNDYYITVNASNLTANSIVVPIYDADSRSRLNGPVWCVPAAGSFTIHTSAIPSNTVTILVQIPGTMGEAQYQVLADVYSKSQAVAKADIVNNLTSTSTTAPLSANMGKTLHDKVTQFSFSNEYSSLLSAINSVRTTKAYPISFTKIGNAALSDLPADITNTSEINGIIFGTDRRITVLIHNYTGNTPVISVWIRTAFDGNWYSDWLKISN